MYKSTIALLLAFLVLLVSPAVAAEKPSLSSWDGVKQLRAGQQVRAWLADRVVTGTLLSASDDELVVRQAGREVTLKRGEIVRLAALNHRGGKMAIGAVVGGAAGFACAVGILEASGHPRYPSAGVGVAAGMVVWSSPVIGAVLGSRWGTQTVYREPKQ